MNGKIVAQLVFEADVRGMLQLMKDCVRTRGAWMDSVLMGHKPIPPTLSASSAGALNFSAKELRFSATTTNANGESKFEWRLAEVAGAKLHADRKDEIASLWQTNGTTTVQVPASYLEAGGTYRVRARAQDAAGRCGHWSASVQFTVPK